MYVRYLNRDSTVLYNAIYSIANTKIKRHKLFYENQVKTKKLLNVPSNKKLFNKLHICIVMRI